MLRGKKMNHFIIFMMRLAVFFIASQSCWIIFHIQKGWAGHSLLLKSARVVECFTRSYWLVSLVLWTVRPHALTICVPGAGAFCWLSSFTHLRYPGFIHHIYYTSFLICSDFPFYFNVLFQVLKRSKYLNTFIWPYNIVYVSITP